MSSVDGESARLTVPLATAATEARSLRRGPDGAAPPAEGLPATTAATAPVEPAAPVPPPEAPGGGLAALRDQARAAQAKLAHQPLQITNSNSRLIMKLFGGGPAAPPLRRERPRPVAAFLVGANPRTSSTRESASDAVSRQGF